VAAALVAVAAASGDRTRVATWSPFAANGTLKRSLRIEPLGRGGCGSGPGSETIGEYGYRCFAKNVVGDPCWRDGPRPTDLVVCPDSPWAGKAATIRMPHLMLEAGVTFAAPVDAGRDPPWALELASGNRCIVAQGAHDSIVLKDGRRLVVDYFCERSHIVLLRNLRRGRVWRIGTARWNGRRYRLLGAAVVRRAVFASLPPPMRRQNDLGREAAAASGLRLSQVLRVRMAFPALDWANVEALAPETSKAITVRRVVHRTGRRWSVVLVRRPVCRDGRVPPSARRQLFDCGPR
jgi:hypothetical protein